MATLLEPFGYEFFRNALAVLVLAGALCGLVGVFVVLRGMSYIGHGLSHAIFGWAVMSFVVEVNFFAGAGLGGFASALAVNRVARRRTIGADAAIGVVTTALFAAGIALISRARGFTQNFEAALFGSVLGVGLADIAVVGLAMILVTAFVVLRYRPLLFMTFDPEVAEASGIRTGRLDAAFAMALAATIVATMQVLGVTLVAAALVIPAVIARLASDSFGRMLWLSTLIGAGSGLVGFYLAYYLDISPGAAIVLLEATLFVIAFTLSGRRKPRLAGADAHL